jgi:arsenate reductase
MDQKDPEGKFRVLFLCTGNSARSIMAESIMRQLAGDRFETFSAGSHPAGQVHPRAIEVLRDYYGIDAANARSKSWDEFRGQPLDFVITVCDSAREACPYWPGQPVLAHWGTDDPAAYVGTPKGQLAAFRKAATELHRRIDLFRNLPLSTLSRMQVEQQTAQIGKQ